MYWMRVSGSTHSRNPTVLSTASKVTTSHDWHMEVACLRERSVAKSVSDPFAALNDHEGRSEKRHQLFASVSVRPAFTTRPRALTPLPFVGATRLILNSVVSTPTPGGMRLSAA